jgi:hypothetical protein
MNHQLFLRLFSLFRREDAPALAWTTLITLFVGILFSLPPQSSIFALGSHSTSTATSALSPAPTLPQPLLCFVSQRVGAALSRPLGLCGTRHLGLPLVSPPSQPAPGSNLRSGRSLDRFPAPPRRLCAGALGFLSSRGTANPRCALGSSPTNAMAPWVGASVYLERRKAPALRTADNWAGGPGLQPRTRSAPDDPEELFLSITKEANP